MKEISPVLFLIFNRLETTKQAFQAIRNAEPKQLFTNISHYLTI